jgi:hypothetical protein
VADSAPARTTIACPAMETKLERGTWCQRVTVMV